MTKRKNICFGQVLKLQNNYFAEKILCAFRSSFGNELWSLASKILNA